MAQSLKSRRRKEGRGGGEDLYKTVKVVSILFFLLFVLYMLSFSMNNRRSPVEAQEYDGEDLSVAMALLGNGERGPSGEKQFRDADDATEGTDLEALNQAGNLDAILKDGGVGLGDLETNGEELERYLSTIPFSNNDVPGVRGVHLVFGNLSNAYRSARRDAVRKRLDLPRVFPQDFRKWRESLKSRRKVCVFTRTPRQDSLFRTNVLSVFGTGSYNYVIMRSTQCQHDGTCTSAAMARKHPQCNPAIMPTIHLLERVKNFQHDRHEQVLSNGMQFYDVLVATGDEYCRATNTFDRAHFRMYHGPHVVNASLRTPIYLPLGPREEFLRVKPSEVRLVAERKYVFNFLGSLTSDARKELIQVVRKLHGVRSFVHVIAKWAKKLTPNNGYVPPAQYRLAILNSVFTLCPQGHNPEAYRIFEACEAGSIPIVVMDKHYRTHECEGAFAALIAQGAPFVFLNSWYELPEFLKRISQDTRRLQQMQVDVMEWYSKFMQKVAMQFETVMQLRFEDRSDRGDFTSTRSLANVETYLDDPKYVHPL